MGKAFGNTMYSFETFSESNFNKSLVVIPNFVHVNLYRCVIPRLIDCQLINARLLPFLYE